MHDILTLDLEYFKTACSVPSGGPYILAVFLFNICEFCKSSCELVLVLFRLVLGTVIGFCVELQIWFVFTTSGHPSLECNTCYLKSVVQSSVIKCTVSSR